MRVLFLTWVDPDDPRQRGGGLSVYQRALLAGLRARGGIESAVLSSGLAQDLLRGAPRIEPLGPGRYALVNAGLLAPSQADFASAAQIAHADTEAVFDRFLTETGPWDVVHVNTLEGFPAQVLALAAARARVVVSLHNYYPFCPQVNLWQREAAHCDDFRGGAACSTCLPVVPDARAVRAVYALEWAMERRGMGPGTAVFDRGLRPLVGAGWRMARRLLRLRRAAPVTLADPAPAFAARRQQMVGLINRHAAAVLCVSDRVRQIAQGFGLAPERLHTLPIGTAAADLWAQTQPRARFLNPDSTLTLAYLGYMRRDKGFHFLMQALAALPAPLAARLRLTVAARRGDTEAMALMAAAGARLAGLRHVDGYGPGDLDSLLADVALGVVPVLWEDNLPQVAIEMHARHIPLLTSDRGGAHELGRCPALTFPAGDGAALGRVIETVLQGSLSPDAYWQTAVAPVRMADHVEALVRIYSG